MNADIRPIRTAAEQAFATAYEDAKTRLPGGPEIARLRERAFSAFADSGLPTRRVEDWKYTDLRTLLREVAPLASPPDAGAIARAKETVSLPVTNLRRITLVNGAFVPELSDLGGLETKLTVVPLAKALAESHPLTGMICKLRPETHDATLALNAAFLNDGILIEVGEGAVLERPIYIRHVFAGDTAATVFTRCLVKLHQGAAATFVESFEGPVDVAYQRNATMELHVADRANLAFVRLQAEGESALHVSSLLTVIAGGAEFAFAALTLGATASRQNVGLRLAGEHTQIDLAGATLMRGRQHADSTLVLDHAVPNCTSRVTFRSVLDGTSRGVVQGRIVVRPDAQKTDARMSLGALLLAEGAEADQKPELEIFADDVQCAHGATSGALDEQLLFYLLARGIPRKQAEALLIQAFFGAALEQIRHEGLREALMEKAAGWLELRGRAS